MTNKPELTDEKIKRRINDIEDRRSASRDFWGGDYEYPEDIELMALRELQELRRSYLALRGEIEDVQAQLYEAENRNEADDTELQERRKADSAPTAITTTAEQRRVIEMLLAVCGAAFELADDSCQQDVDGEACHVVPDDSFKTLARALDEIENTLPTEDADRPDVFLAWAAMPRAVLKSLLQAAPPAPVVPDEKPMPEASKMHAIDAVAAIAEVRGWNAYRAAMLKTAPKQENF